MDPLELALVTLALALAALPGWALARRLAPGRSEGEALALGAALGVAGHAALGLAVPSLLGRPLAAIGLGLALVLLASGPRPRLPRARPAGLLAFAAALVVTASYVPLVLESAMPRGWDPSFHTLLIERIASTGELPRTWEPWEPVSVHYTLGFHALLAHVARLTGLPAHSVFQGGFPFASGMVAASSFFLARGIGLGRARATFATLALGLLATRIRLVYFWGGLPTVLGLAIALAAGASLARVPGRRGLLLGGALLGALPAFHHLSALIAFCTTAAVALALALRPRTRPAARRASAALALAALLALPLLPAVLTAASARDATSILRFEDEPALPIADYPLAWGVALSGLAVAGLVLGGRRRRAIGPLAALGSLVFVHFLLDVVYRALARRWTGDDFSALTPSRWFTLASVPLALFAGEAAGRLHRILRRRWPRVAAPLVALGLVLVAVPRWARVELGSRGVDPALLRAGAWVRAQVPGDAFVVVRARSFVTTGVLRPEERGLLPARYWWPYLLGLETDATPLPASEPRRDPRVVAKRGVRASGEDVVAARAVARSRGKRLFWLGPASLPPVAGAVRLGVWEGLVALDEVR